MNAQMYVCACSCPQELCLQAQGCSCALASQDPTNLRAAWQLLAQPTPKPGVCRAFHQALDPTKRDSPLSLPALLQSCLLALQLRLPLCNWEEPSSAVGPAGGAQAAGGKSPALSKSAHTWPDPASRHSILADFCLEEPVLLPHARLGSPCAKRAWLSPQCCPRSYAAALVAEAQSLPWGWSCQSRNGAESCHGAGPCVGSRQASPSGALAAKHREGESSSGCRDRRWGGGMAAG